MHMCFKSEKKTREFKVIHMKEVSVINSISNGEKSIENPWQKRTTVVQKAKTAPNNLLDYKLSTRNFPLSLEEQIESMQSL